MKEFRAFAISRAVGFCLIFMGLNCATLNVPVLAQGQPNVSLLKMTYDAGDYQACARLASDIIARQPNNGYAHYYLGCTMARYGKVDAARKSLTKCQSLSVGTELGKLAERALFDLLPYDGRVKKAVEPKLSSADSMERRRLLSEQEREIKAAEERFNDNVNRLQKSLSPAELRLATQKEFEQLSKEQASITERYQRRADALLRRGSVPSSGNQPAIAPYSANSNYVQNYLNSGDPSQAASIPSENPMDARALKMGEKDGKSAAVKTNSKKQGGK